MVPINFHEYRAEIKRAVLSKKDSLESEWDGFFAAWVAYALSADGIQDNPPLSDILERLQRWASENSTWEAQRNLGPLAYLFWLCTQLGTSCDSVSVTTLSERVLALNPEDNLSLLRDPEQVFLLALGLKAEARPKARLVEVAKQQISRGPLRRKILYAAALKELGESVTLPQGKPQDAGDSLALVWWAERYSDDLQKDEVWNQFGNMIEVISLVPEQASESQRVLSVPELALLYETVCREASNPDPLLLFEYFPLHLRMKEIVREYFRNGKYVSAVEQACRILNEMIQDKSNVRDKSEIKLVEATMSMEGNRTPIIKFNQYLTEISGKNEQEGITLMFKGVFKAFRNPKAHKPEGHPLVHLEAYDALMQLVVISYLMKRIDEADVQVGGSRESRS